MSTSSRAVGPTAENLTFTRLPAESIGITHKFREGLPARPRCYFPIVIKSASGLLNETIRMDGEFCTPEQLPAAVVAGDYDNDGHVDLFFTVTEDRSRLYRNLGKPVIVLCV